MNSGCPIPFLAAAVVVAVLVTGLPARAQLGTGKLVAKQVVTGLARPVFVTSPPGDADRLFIVERIISTGLTGRLRIYDKTTQSLLATPFLQIPGVNSGGEEGLLGLAFHPNYAANGHFYIYYSDSVGSRISRLVRYTANAPFATATTANAATAIEVLRFSQPQSNHNGGWIGFNPTAADNGQATGNPRHYLYVGTGDGGNRDDVGAGHDGLIGNSQDITNNPLGKILRLDTGSDGNADAFTADTLRNYAIPPDNPFVGLTGDDEIWSYGLRNPWRCAFDRGTGDFWIADVGQNTREEIHVQPAAEFTAADPLAANYGWRFREGDIATPSGGVGGILPGDLPARDGIPAGQFAPGTSGLVEPVLDYVRVTNPSPEFQTDNGSQFYGSSITGGCVYRGSMKWLQGAYFFGDYGSGRFYSIRYDGATVGEKLRWSTASPFENLVIDPPDSPTAPLFVNFASFSEGGDGEIYVCTRPQNGAGDTGGSVYVLTQKPFFRYRSTYFTEAELNDDAISGPDADADGDGWTVAQEFALNTDPTVPNGGPGTIGIEDDGGLDEFFTFTLEVSPEAKEAVTYTGEAGGTLLDFDAANAVTEFDPATGTTLKVRDLTPVSASARRFLFLGFEIPPAELEE